MLAAILGIVCSKAAHVGGLRPLLAWPKQTVPMMQRNGIVRACFMCRKWAARSTQLDMLIN